MKAALVSNFFTTALVILAVGVWAVILSANGWVIPTSFFAPLSSVVSVLSLALLVFDKWGWSWWGLRWVARHPDLRGTWRGTFESSWVDPETAARKGPIACFLIVKQTYSGLHLRLMTTESTSVSLATTLVEEADGTWSVNGLYRNQPRVTLQERSRIHHGGLVLCVGGPPPDSLSGHYWTDRSTRGEMRLDRMSRAYADDYAAAEKLAGSLSGVGKTKT
jgi:hypothetical protein